MRALALLNQLGRAILIPIFLCVFIGIVLDRVTGREALFLIVFITIVLTLLCTLLTYYKYAANIALTPIIIELAFINDIRTCMDIFNWKLCCYLIVSLLF